MGWTLLCIVVFFGAQIAASLVFFGIRLAQNPNAKPADVAADVAADGNLFGVGTLGSIGPLLGLIAFLIWVRGCWIRDYLALIWPNSRSVFVGIVGLGIVMVTSDMTSYVLGRPLVPEVMVQVYRTAWLPGLLFALIVLAPLGEETLFRGFLYKGIAASRAGPITAILLSTVLFAIMHIQYDWYGVLLVAGMGLYLAVVRFGSGSLLLTMLLHGIANVVATAEMVVQEHWMR